MARTRATLRDVALAAGVSVKTVARVVNDEGGVRREKVVAIEQAVRELGYRPHPVAASLRRSDGRTRSIGALLEDLANPFSASVLRAIEDVARERGIVVFTGSLDEDPERERELVRTFADRRADALVLVPASADQAYLTDELDDGIPLVLVDRAPVGLAADAVLSDHRGGAAEAVRHLVRSGHRRIGFVGDDPGIATARDRLAGYRDAMAEAGLAVDEAVVVSGPDDAEVATTALLDLAEPPTALFTAQNVLTIAATRALHRRGQQHHVAVVGFDDFPLADLVDPGVTVVAQDPAEIGRRAAALLFGRLEGADAGAPSVHVVPTTLLPRGSGEIPPA